MGEVTFVELMDSMGCAMLLGGGGGGGSVMVTSDGGGGGGYDLEGTTIITNHLSVQWSTTWDTVAYVFAELFGVTFAGLLYIAHRKRNGVQKIKMEKFSTVEEA